MDEHHIHSKEARLAQADPKAVTVAAAIHETAQPDLTILFGSRAKGNWRPNSDLDLLVIAEWDADDAKVDAAAQVGQEAADHLYPKPPVTVNLTVLDREELATFSRSINHVIRRALNYGILFPNNLYHDLRYCSPPADYSGETYVAQHLSHKAQLAADQFHEYVNNPRFHWDHAIGRQAQQAVNNALHAVISARRRPFPITQDLVTLYRHANRVDPGLNWQPAIDLNCYNQYAPHNEDRPPASPLTDLPDYAELFEQDLQQLLERIRNIQKGN